MPVNALNTFSKYRINARNAQITVFSVKVPQTVRSVLMNSSYHPELVLLASKTVRLVQVLQFAINALVVLVSSVPNV
jgi:hypothetical protein